MTHLHSRGGISRRTFGLGLMGGVGLGAFAGLVPAEAKQVLVLGGGPAGAQAALGLKQALPRNRVVLLERDPTRFGPRSGTGNALVRPSANVSLTDLQNNGVEVVLDEAVDLDWRAGRVALFSGRSLPFDHLTLAPGTAPRAEDIAGYDARARHLWPAAWGSTQEARRLAAQVAAVPDGGHIVLRLPAELSHPDVVITRLQWLGAKAAKRNARLTVLEAGADAAVKAKAQRLSHLVDLDWHQNATVHAIDASLGRMETSAGEIRADVVNFVPRQGAGRIAQVAGLVDASGWCPVDESNLSTRNAQATVLGDARLGALRSVHGSVG